MTKNIPPDERNDVSLYDQTTGAKDPNSPSAFRNFRFIGFLIFIFIFLIPYGYFHGFAAFLFSTVTFLEVISLQHPDHRPRAGPFPSPRSGAGSRSTSSPSGSASRSGRAPSTASSTSSAPCPPAVTSRCRRWPTPEALEGKGDVPREELPPASPWQKIIVAFAGPLFSFGLALFFACIVWLAGKPVQYEEGTTTIGYILPNSPADKAGLKPGDKFVSIDGHPINHFMGMGDSVIWRVVTSTADTISVVIQRGSETKTLMIAPQKDLEHEHAWYQRGATRKIGVGPAAGALTIKKLTPNGPALTAGLRPGDTITRSTASRSTHSSRWRTCSRTTPTRPSSSPSSGARRMLRRTAV